MTGKKRKNYAEQQTNYDNLQVLISLFKQEKEGASGGQMLAGGGPNKKFKSSNERDSLA